MNILLYGWILKFDVLTCSFNLIESKIWNTIDRSLVKIWCRNYFKCSIRLHTVNQVNWDWCGQICDLLFLNLYQIKVPSSQSSISTFHYIILVPHYLTWITTFVILTKECIYIRPRWLLTVCTWIQFWQFFTNLNKKSINPDDYMY